MFCRNELTTTLRSVHTKLENSILPRGNVLGTYLFHRHTQFENFTVPSEDLERGMYLGIGAKAEAIRGS